MLSPFTHKAPFVSGSASTQRNLFRHYARSKLTPLQLVVMITHHCCCGGAKRCQFIISSDVNSRDSGSRFQLVYWSDPTCSFVSDR